MPDLDLDYEASRSLRRIRPKISEKINAIADARLDAAQLLETIDIRLAQVSYEMVIKR